MPALRRLAVLLGATLVLFLAWFGWHSWQQERQAQYREMRTVLEITATAIDRYLREVEAGLGAVAYDLQEEGGMSDLAQVQKTLRRFHDAHPDAASITLSRRADGRLLASSTTTELDNLPANTGVGGPIFAPSQDDARLAGRLILGRPLLGALVQTWVFPLAYMVYGKDGRIVAVLTMAMPVDFVQAFWKAAPLSEDMTIGLVRDDGLLVSRWKLPAGVPLSEVYGVKRNGRLQQHLIAAGFPDSGYVEGYNELAKTTAGNVFRRLPRFGVTTYVSLPLAEVQAAWWRRVRVPYGLAMLLAGLVFFGYRLVLRREAAIEAERRTAEVAASASRAKSQFIARMSHELRTPLNAVLGLAELMTLDPRHALAAEQRERVHRIRVAGQHLLSLINDLLDLSQIEAGAMRLQASTFRPAELLDEVVREMEPVAARLDLRIALHASCSGAELAHTDRTRVKQILLNLLSNAIKYNEARGDVVIDATCEPHRLAFSVADTGPGMSAEQLGSLFQPFNRLGRDGSTAGTGIGLTITRHLVQLLHGELTVESTVGVGTRFNVTIPLEAPPQAPAALGVGAPSPDAQGTAHLAFVASRRPLHLLYVDDDEVNRIIVAGYLQLVPHVSVSLAARGEEFLEIARKLPADVMLVDMMMPGMSGLDVIRAVRADPALRRTPCIAISANAMAEEIREAREAGFDGYVTKPISAAALHAEIARVVTD